MTKQVAIVFVLPSALIILVNQDQWGRRARMALVAGCCVVPVLAMGFISNYQLYGTILGQRATDPQAVSFFNSSFTSGVIVENIVRNTLIQLPLPGIAPYIDRIHGLNDSRTTWNGATFHVPTVPIPQEDIAPNPIQLGIIVIGGFMVLRRGTTRERLVVAEGAPTFAQGSVAIGASESDVQRDLVDALPEPPFEILPEGQDQIGEAGSPTGLQARRGRGTGEGILPATVAHVQDLNLRRTTDGLRFRAVAGAGAGSG
jgi:hypothetical protein